MPKRYRLHILKRPRVFSDGCITVAYVADKLTSKPVLVIDVVRDLLKNKKQTCCFVEEREADHIPGEYYGLVQMEARVFVEDMLNDRRMGNVSIMHELGHYLCGHHKPEKMVEDYSRVRKEFDGVMPQELEADEFAIRECGIKDFLYFIDKLTAKRQSYEWDKNREIALKEFGLRKEHALEYAKKLQSEDDRV